MVLSRAVNVRGDRRGPNNISSLKAAAPAGINDYEDDHCVRESA
jgi:hypothetical protein